MTDLQWRVTWSDWRGHHDWIGRYNAKPGGVIKKHRKKPPPPHQRDFDTRADAERFLAELRCVIPEGELVAQILAPRAPDPPPTDPWLPGDWPLRRRGE